MPFKRRQDRLGIILCIKGDQLISFLISKLLRHCQVWLALMSYTNKTLTVFTALGDGFCKHPSFVHRKRMGCSQTHRVSWSVRKKAGVKKVVNMKVCGAVENTWGMLNVLTKLLLKLFERKAGCWNMWSSRMEDHVWWMTPWSWVLWSRLGCPESLKFV